MLALVSLNLYFATWYIATYTPFPDTQTLVHTISNATLWTTLYLVKATFLALVQAIFSISARFRIAWWIVTIYTFTTFWPVFLSEFWQCGKPSSDGDSAACSDAVFYSSMLIPAWLKLFFHLSSEIFILALPLAQIKKLHMSLTRKLTIASVFALIIIDIILGAIKNAGVVCLDTSRGLSLPCSDILTVGTVVEPALAVIVCALPVYRAILPSSRRHRKRLVQSTQQQEIAAKVSGEPGPEAMALKPIETLPFEFDDSLVTEPELAHVAASAV